jgi:hypothetical protein
MRPAPLYWRQNGHDRELVVRRLAVLLGAADISLIYRIDEAGA